MDKYSIKAMNFLFELRNECSTYCQLWQTTLIASSHASLFFCVRCFRNSFCLEMCDFNVLSVFSFTGFEVSKGECARGKCALIIKQLWQIVKVDSEQWSNSGITAQLLYIAFTMFRILSVRL